MLGKILTSSVVVAALASGAVAHDAQAVLDKAAKTLGVEGLKTLQYSATGFDYALGQAPTPESPWPKFIEKSYTRTIDFDAQTSRVERVRLQGETPPRGGGGQPINGEQKQIQTLVVDAKTPWTQQAEILVTPYGFLRAAVARNATVATRKIGGESFEVVTFKGVNDVPVNGYINARNELVRVETSIDNPVLGDTLYETRYSDYKTFGAVKFPAHIVQAQGGYPVLDLSVQDVKTNQPVRFDAAQDTNSANPPARTERLGDGLYLLTGRYSVIVADFKDHLVLFESGQSEERALAVIDEAKKLFPGKPIKYVVNTHSHFDHSGGLRAFVAEGSTILTQQLNKSYLEKVLARPHTINPDKAQRLGAKPKVQSVAADGKYVLTDGARVVELYRLEDFTHHDGTLVAYFPKEKLLFQADAYNPQALDAAPPNPPSPYNVSLLDNIQRLKLDVQRIIPVHYPVDARVVTVNELNRWIGRSENAAAR
jgi:glyoxylase-like metal-dependent hydrolase (beta-lactamase superfamily II)